MALVIFLIVAIKKPSGPADEARQDETVRLIDVSSQFKTKGGIVLYVMLSARPAFCIGVPLKFEGNSFENIAAVSALDSEPSCKTILADRP